MILDEMKKPLGQLMVKILERLKANLVLRGLDLRGLREGLGVDTCKSQKAICRHQINRLADGLG